MQRLSLPTADLADFSYKSVYVSLTIDTRKWAVTKRDESRGACRLVRFYALFHGIPPKTWKSVNMMLILYWKSVIKYKISSWKNVIY